MYQTFDETTDPSFGPKHVPLIRAAMKAQGLDGFLAPHEDEHQNEYLPAANDRLGWASGFTGSAGAAVMGCFVISILAKLVFVVVDIFKTELTKRDEWIRELISRVGKDE